MKSFLFKSTDTFNRFENIVQITPSVSIPNHENDHHFERELFKGTINICQLNNIFKTRLLLKVVMETFLNGLEEPFSCPVKKVFKIQHNFLLLTIYLQGPIKLLNCSLKNNTVPGLVSTSKFKFSGNLMGKLPNQKKFIRICTTEIYAKYNRPK